MSAGTATETILRALLVLLAFGAAACEPRPEPEPPGPRQFEATGIVIEAKGDFVLIDHQDIPGFMDAMTMTFPVTHRSVLSGIADGDRVRFGIVVHEDGTYQVDRIERTAGAKPND